MLSENFPVEHFESPDGTLAHQSSNDPRPTTRSGFPLLAQAVQNGVATFPRVRYPSTRNQRPFSQALDKRIATRPDHPAVPEAAAERSVCLESDRCHRASGPFEKRERGFAATWNGRCPFYRPIAPLLPLTLIFG